MAVRRPRFKPTANLKPRRAASTTGDSTSSQSVAIEKDENNERSVKVEVICQENSTKEEIATTSKHQNIVKQVDQNAQTIDNIPNEIECKEETPKPASHQTKTNPVRRLIKPVVSLPTERSKKSNVTVKKTQDPSSKICESSENAESDQQSSKSHDINQQISETNPEQVASIQVRNLSEILAVQKTEQSITNTEDNSIDSIVVVGQPQIEQTSTANTKQTDTIDNTKSKESPDYFKSPFMSPSMQNSHQNYWSLPSPGIIDGIMPLSPARVRQRIRPTPCFGNRRNSIQGVNESDDETSRRQRHLSTSSTHSNYHPNNNISRALGRVRTESSCSNISDVNSVRDAGIKLKQSYRSEAFKKITNARKDLNKMLNGKPPDKARLKMFDLIYYNPVTNPMKNPAKSLKDRRLSSVSDGSSQNVKKEEPPVPKSETPPKPEIAAPVPQLKLGPNGEIILDEQSLVIETTRGKEAREALANSSLIYDDEFSGTSGFYKRCKRTRDWPPEETIKFYRSLHTVGTDFSLMLQLFPNRSRKDLKSKFKREERLNLDLVNKALLHPKLFNIDELRSEFETEEKELERLREEWKELKVNRAKEKRAVSSTVHSMAARVLSDSNLVNEFEFAAPPKRRKKKTAENQTENVGEATPAKRGRKAKNTVVQQPSSPANCFNSPINQRRSSIESINSPGLFMENQLFNSNQTQTGDGDRSNSSVISYVGPSLKPIRTISIDSIIATKDLHELQLIDDSDDNSIFSVCSVQSHDTSPAINTNSRQISSTDILNMDIVFQDHNSNDPNVPIESQSRGISKIEPNHDQAVQPESNEMVIYHNTIQSDMENIERNPATIDHPNSLNIKIDPSNDLNTVRTIEIQTSQPVVEEQQINPEEIEEEIYYDGGAEYQDEYFADPPYEMEKNNIITSIVNEATVPTDPVAESTNYETADFDDDEDGEDLKSLRDSLVVVATQDPTDANKVTHEVFLISPSTGELSEEPLDLPPDVIERIIATLVLKK